MNIDRDLFEKNLERLQSSNFGLQFDHESWVGPHMIPKSASST
jgi:hypothetical protein